MSRTTARPHFESLRLVVDESPLVLVLLQPCAENRELDDDSFLDVAWDVLVGDFPL